MHTGRPGCSDDTSSFVQCSVISSLITFIICYQLRLADMEKLAWPKVCVMLALYLLLSCCGAALHRDYLAVKRCGVFFASYLELHISFCLTSSGVFFFLACCRIGKTKGTTVTIRKLQNEAQFFCFVFLCRNSNLYLK